MLRSGKSGFISRSRYFAIVHNRSKIPFGARPALFPLIYRLKVAVHLDIEHVIPSQIVELSDLKLSFVASERNLVVHPRQFLRVY